MRLLFVDEAGTATNQPVSVVVGLLVDSGNQRTLAENMVWQAIEHEVPARYRDSFVFHATDIWNSKNFRDGWNLDDRMRFLKIMMGFPRVLNIPIVVGMVRRDSLQRENKLLSVAQFHHVQAFFGCLWRAERYVAESQSPDDEIAVVAENVPEMKRFLKLATRMPDLCLPAEHLIPTVRQRQLGQVPEGCVFSMSRIAQRIEFVSKGDPILFMTDACAFGLKRYFSGWPYVEEMIRAMLGGLPNLEDFRSPVHFCAFDGENHEFVRQALRDVPSEAGKPLD